MSKIKELSYERLIRVVHPVIHSINGSVEERIGTSYSEEGDSIPGPWAIFAARGQVRNKVATGMGIARMSVKAVMKSQTRKETNGRTELTNL